MGSSWVIYPIFMATWQVTIRPSHGRCGVSSRWAAGAEHGLRRLRPCRSPRPATFWWMSRVGPFLWGNQFNVNILNHLKSFQKVLVGWSSCGICGLINVNLPQNMEKSKEKYMNMNKEQVTSQFAFRGSWPVQKKRHINIDIPNSIEVSTLLPAVSVKCALPRRFIFGNSRWV